MPAAFESHGMDLRWQGWVASTYGIISFFVGPMLGRVSDSMGRVAMLKMSCVGNIIGALGSLYATGRWTFIASRTLPGLLKCSLPISQAYMVDVSEGSAERSKNLGMLGASFGVAFVLGPPLGGTAADYDVRLPFVISFLESVLLYLALQYLPEPSKSLASKKDDGDRTGGREGAISSGGARGLGGDGGEAGLARVAAVDQAEVIASTASSFCSPKATPGSARKKTLTRIRSSLQVASESGRTTAPASATAGRGAGVVESSSSSTGLKRTRSSAMIAAAEKGVFAAEDLMLARDRMAAVASPGRGGGGATPGSSSSRTARRLSPARLRGKTLASSAVVGGTTAAATAVVVTPAPAPAPAPPAGGGGGDTAAGGGGGGRLGIFRGPGGRQMAWGFHDRFFLVLAESMYHTSFAPFLTTVLSFPTGTVGFLLSFMGMVAALTNAFLVGALTKRLGERPLLASSLVVLAGGWVMWSTISGSLPAIVVSLTLAGVGSNVFQTVNKASVAQHAPPELVGTVMGMSAALETFGRSVAGPMSGYLFETVGARGIPLTCSCAAAYVTFALSIRGFAESARGGDDAGGEKGSGPHNRGSRSYTKIK
ncbi:unnamed protein product [Ectocarpus sp. 13 AM-2016]